MKTHAKMGKQHHEEIERKKKYFQKLKQMSEVKKYLNGTYTKLDSSEKIRELKTGLETKHLN